MEKRTAYDIMKSAVDKKFKPTPEEIKKINSFFLIRYVSNDPNTIYIANALNCNYNIPIEAQYNFIRNSTLDRVAFINYPKKEETYLENDVKIIMKHYNINKTLAKEYISILGEDRTQEIIKKYQKSGVLKKS